MQENPESNAQPETCIVPETERDLPRTAHKVIGEVFDTYIILEYDAQTLMFIDKHAAHERLLYEKLKRREEAAMARDGDDGQKRVHGGFAEFECF